MATDAAPRKSPTASASSRRTAFVTGASSGIGEAFARELARQGYGVVVIARRKDRLDSLAKELTDAGAEVEVLEADLSTASGVETARARIAQGDIDMLINNAGFGTNSPFVDLPLERELEEIDLNIRALTQPSHAALQQMRGRKRGTIINVASTGAFQPVPYMATYAGTKAYVLHFSEALHEEAKRFGVTVTCLCPGGTRTEFQGVAGVNEASLPKVGWSTPDAVVKHALNAARAGSAIAVPGFVNKTTANLPRLAPRFFVRKVAGRMFKKE